MVESCLLFLRSALMLNAFVFGGEGRTTEESGACYEAQSSTEKSLLLFFLFYYRPLLGYSFTLPTLATILASQLALAFLCLLVPIHGVSCISHSVKEK